HASTMIGSSSSSDGYLHVTHGGSNGGRAPALTSVRTSSASWVSRKRAKKGRFCMELLQVGRLGLARRAPERSGRLGAERAPSLGRLEQPGNGRARQDPVSASSRVA